MHNLLEALLLLALPAQAQAPGALSQLRLNSENPAITAPALPQPLMPEDGSLPLAAWYTAVGNGHPSPALRAALAAEGVELRDLEFDYEWAQDIALFGAGGELVLQADAPPRLLQEIGLTIGVLNNEDGYPALTALAEADASRLGLPWRRMEWTFLEGGGLITGLFADGRPYAITSRTPVLGAQLLYEYRRGVKITESEARLLVAADLRVEPENLFVVSSSRHLDLSITALPGGTLLLSDPSKTAETLKSLLAGRPSKEDKERLEGMLKIYTEGWQPRDNFGKPMGPRQFPYDGYEVTGLDNMEKALGARFKVVRAAGVFKELNAYANSKDSFYIADRINFFNGLMGRNAAGEVYQLTNGARGLAALQQYWTGLLAAHGAARVHFPGGYSGGAGLDCAGAPSGR